MLREVVLRDATAGEWLLFREPAEVLVAREVPDVLAVIREAECRVRDERLFAVGYIGYEAAPAFDSACVTLPPGDFPLACLGLFHAPQKLDTLPRPGDLSAPLREWSFDGSRESYLSTIERIREQIRAGNTYQVNYTVRQRARGIRDAWELFLSTATDAPYAAYLDCSDRAIVSASPELFFRLDGERLVCKPMKGTAARGMTATDDLRRRDMLQHSVKDRAENVMIADMVRNDLGRIAEPGSVHAEALYDIEKYRTVWQMTSTITASTRVPAAAIFQALFPSASVTGAPKVSAMKLIANLEDSPRQVYTGAIGLLAPDRRAQFSVAIRTAVVDHRTGAGTYGVGGGIVWDSDAHDEYQECLNKAKVLATPLPGGDFCLLETLLWKPGEGLVLLQAHLDRLEASAGYFDFVHDRAGIEARLAELAGSLPDVQDHRVRLLLDRDGEVRIEARLLATPSDGQALRLALAASPVDGQNPFLYHKTTERSAYDRALAAAGDCDDVLLWNTAGEITESTIANVIVQIGGKLYTPPVECGLLAGTFRAQLLRQRVVEERRIRVAEVAGAEALFLVNSVRGWMRCRLVEASVAEGANALL